MKSPKLIKDSVPQEKISAFDKDKLSEYMDAINSEYALVLRGSQVLVMRYWIGEEGTSRLTFLSTKDFHTLMANQQIWDKRAEKYIPLSQLWMRSKERKQYEDVYFRPCDKLYERRYNLWHGFAYVPKQEGSHDLFLNHIEENICQGNIEYYNWIIDWLADLIQKPHRKPGTAIVLRGEMGTGKGQFAFHIGQLFGQHYIPIIHGAQLTTRFNSHLADKVLVFVDESGWSHDKYGAGVIRGMITEPSIAIEMKGKDIITMENYGHFIIAANSEWAVPASMHDERRFAVFNMGEKYRGDKPYFEAIDNQMKGGGYESLLFFLMNHQYDEIIARTIPQTDALAEQKIHSMPDELTWWHECLLYEKIGDFHLYNDDSNWLPSDKLYEHYQYWCSKIRVRPLSDNILPKNLKKVVPLERKRRILEPNGKPDYCYFLPNIDALRQEFDNFLGSPYNWPKDA